MQRQWRSDIAMKKETFYIILALLVILEVATCLYFTKWRTPVDPVVITETDTVTVFKTDTIISEIRTPIKEVIVDTIVVEKVRDSVVYLPIMRRYYKGTEYEAWVSGYQPKLDSIVVYPQTKYQYITNNITERQLVRNYALYLDAGFMFYDKKVAPCIALQLTTPQPWTIGVGVGYIEGKVGLGFNLGFKIFETK